MAGYSGTPQARKLGLKPGHRFGLDHPPAGWRLTGPPPERIYDWSGHRFVWRTANRPPS
jgi:hypothetical protein